MEIIQNIQIVEWRELREKVSQALNAREWEWKCYKVYREHCKSSLFCRAATGGTEKIHRDIPSVYQVRNHSTRRGTRRRYKYSRRGNR